MAEINNIPEQTQGSTSPLSPLVSVIMPVYNTNYEYLKIAVQSILSQTYHNLELIIVDDCSQTDIFNDVITHFKDDRIHFVRNTQHIGLGASHARNIGLEYAHGKYIAVLDSDDYAYPDRLKKQVDYLENHEDVGILGTKYNQMPDNYIYDKTGSDSYLKTFCLLINPPFGHSTVMMRKSLLDKTGVRYEPDVICDDFRLWLDLIDKTHFSNLNEVLVDYRRHIDNISHEKEADLDWDARRSQVHTAYRLMDKPLSEESENLLCRLLTAQTLLPDQLDKALYLHQKIANYCEKTYGTDATEKALELSYFTLLKSIKDPEYQAAWRNSHVQESFRITPSKQVCSFSDMMLKHYVLQKNHVR